MPIGRVKAAECAGCVKVAECAKCQVDESSGRVKAAKCTKVSSVKWTSQGCKVRQISQGQGPSVK